MKVIVILLLLIKSLSAHRILGIFPHPGLSHFHFFHPIMRSLAEAGHEVTVVSHFPNKPPMDNYKDELLSETNDGLVNVVSLDVRNVFRNQNP
jgi:glucuronosyltransferase